MTKCVGLLVLSLALISSVNAEASTSIRCDECKVLETFVKYVNVRQNLTLADTIPRVRALCPVLSGPAPENSELEKKCGEFVTYHTDDLYNKEDACVSIGLCTAGAVTIGPNSAAREVAPAASPVPVSSSSSSSSSGENDPEKKIAVRLNSADSAKPEQDKPEVVPTGIQKTGKQQLNWEPAPSADDAKAKAGPKSTKKTKALDQDMEDTSDVFR